MHRTLRQTRLTLSAVRSYCPLSLSATSASLVREHATYSRPSKAFTIDPWRPACHTVVRSFAHINVQRIAHELLLVIINTTIDSVRRADRDSKGTEAVCTRRHAAQRRDDVVRDCVQRPVRRTRNRYTGARL